MTLNEPKLGGARDAAGLGDAGTYHSDLTPQERLGLLAAALELERSRDEVRYLEIGILAGATIKYLRDNTTRLRFTGIDLFEDFESASDNTHMSATFKQADVQRALGSSVRLIKGDSREVLREMGDGQERFDLVFIDGNHTCDATRSDLNLVIPLLAPGAWVGFHNCSLHIKPDPKYIMRDGGPWRVTQELRRDPRFFLEIELERIRIFSYNG